ncbi:DNA methyltransferase [Dyella sp. M7H15-1]|uniref:DNA cytosine methyltransferase n=1 Tax=Dyella sp. M7H15-1 TaxID=2501295 RepID=UPI0010052363|nr:DNA cytosine methyltransferase [Dyella sp. M7H15-1]QAU22855.1 DNA methyltransferase [Dyella sp. M7H15-1]
MADGNITTARTKTKVRKTLIADLWCGAGGTITGAVRAAKQMGMQLEVVSVNHWPTAIETHARNYPGCRHHCADLENARPLELVPEGYLDALIASPACTFHSRARGGKPVNDQQRMDPWHVVRWCTELRVKRIMVENVPEFMKWGPCSLVTGRPIPSREGEYFRAWCDALRAIGFRLDYRVICCANYGDATTRERFFLIGCSDAKPLRWPEPTHARSATADLLGSRQQWRGAVEIIDWSTPGKSIFRRKKPLAPNTLRRILAGAKRYQWPEPYIEALQALLDGHEPVLDVPGEAVDPILLHLRGTRPEQLQRSAKDISQPIPTLTAGGEHVGLVMAFGSGGTARELSEPVPTITTGGNGASPHFIEPLLVSPPNGFQIRGAQSTEQPVPAATTRGAGYMTTSILAPYYSSGSGLTAQSVQQPVPAITTKGRFGMAEPVMIRTDQTGSGPNAVRSANDPVHTVVSKQNAGVAQPFVFPLTHHGECRVYSVDDPLRTVTGANRGELAIARPAADTYRIDILYRMLNYRELARAMSFDDGDEVYDFAGNNTEITKQIGNAVPCRTAAALFRALMEDA